MREEQLQQFSKTVETIYAAAVAPEIWPDAVEGIAQVHGAERAALLTPMTSATDGGYLVPYNMTPQSLHEWSTTYIKDDPWVAAGHRRNVVQDGNSFLGEDLVPDDEFVETVFYKDFLSRHDIRWLCTGIVFAGSTPDLPMTTCSVYSGNSGRRFDHETREVHALLLRHLSCALGTMYTLRNAKFKAAKSVRALEELPTALAVIGHRGNVVFANRAAHAIFGLDDGLVLRAGHPITDGFGWLKTKTPSAQAKLDAALKRTLELDVLRSPSFMDAVSLPRPSRKLDLLVRVVPLSPTAEFADASLGAAALVFVTNPEQLPSIDADVLAKLYAVTPAEARVAQELLRGDSVAAIAQRLEVGEATVKTHLRSLFQKTGASRQTQLIRLLLELRR